MATLTTLLTIFKADTTGLKKGHDEAIKLTDDVEKKISSTDLAANKLGSSLVSMARAFTGILAGAVSIGAIVAGLRSAAAETKTLSDLSQQTGASVESIDAWSGAVRHAGGDAAQFQSTLVAMNNTLEDIAFNPKNATIPYFRMLGVGLRNSKGEVKNFLELLPSLAKAFETLTPKQANAYGRRLGLDASTIMLLQKGTREIDSFIKRQKELGVITKADAEIIAKFNAQWEDTGHAFRSLFVTANATLLPVLTKIAKVLENVAVFFKQHSDLIVGGLIAIGTAAAYVVLPALYALVAPFAAIALGAATAIAAVSLLYDDIVNFAEGNDSLIGRAVKKWPELGDAIKAIDLGSKSFLKDLIYGFSELDKWLGGIAFKIRDVLELMGLIPKTNDALNVKYDMRTGVEKNIASGQAIMSSASNSPIAAQSTNSILNTNNTGGSRSIDVRVGDVTIQTQATDGPGIAQDMGEELRNHIRTATGNFNDGVVA